jgi:quercetin dioxygenase-like cupin family protein
MILVRHANDARPADLSAERDAKGVDLRSLITAEDGAKNFTMRLFRLEPGGSTPYHVHAWEHEVFVTGGTGRVRGESGSLPLEAGTAVFVPPEERHRFEAGEDGLVFICCIPLP